MKIKIFATTLFVILALFFSTVTPAFALPPFPEPYWGLVRVNGSFVPAGIHVRALIHGIVYADTTTIISAGSSYYNFLVPGDEAGTPPVEGGVEGDIIVFTIDGVNADQTAIWHSDGLTVNLNLTQTPTSVSLLAFSGTPNFNSVQLNWSTASEVSLVGFNVYRSETPGGMKVKQNTSLLPAKNRGNMEGADYHFYDGVSQGSHYYYWLEMVFVDGSSQSEPIEFTTSFYMFVPTVK